MEIPTQKFEMKDLKEQYPGLGVCKERSGFCLQFVGSRNNTGGKSKGLTYPSLWIHSPSMYVPVENGEPISLEYGFREMSDVAKAMGLDSDRKVSFLCCGSYALQKIKIGKTMSDVCWVTLCSPEETNLLLVVTDFSGENVSADAVKSPVEGLHSIWKGMLEESGRPSTQQAKILLRQYELIFLGTIVTANCMEPSESIKRSKRREVADLINLHFAPTP